MNPAESGPFIRALWSFYQRRGIGWSVLHWLLLPFVFLLWLAIGARLCFVALKEWRRKARLQAAWTAAQLADRNDRLRHPEKYLGVD